MLAVAYGQKEGKDTSQAARKHADERGNHEFPGSEQLCVHRRDT